MTVSKLAGAYSKKYQLKTDVVMFGRGKSAVTAYRTIFEPGAQGMHLVGYIGEKENNKIPGYLGKFDDDNILPFEEMSDGNSKPDMVLMDITMPEVNGIEGVKLIKGYDKDATIIMVSAMGQQEMVVQAIQAGARSFIVKPFKPEKIIEIINNYKK